MPVCSPREAALSYAGLGYCVLPIEPGGKRPVTAWAPRGVYSASDNTRVLRVWFDAMPEANIALVPPAGCVALDFDEAEQFARFLRRWPELEKAPHSRTPRGGAHLYLRIPPGANLRAQSGRALPSFEIKSSRNYLLEAPSRTERGAYRWVVSLCAPSDLPEMPRELLAALQRVVAAAPVTGTPSQTALLDALNREILRIRAAVEGNRHNQLVKSAALVGGLVAQGLDQEYAQKALMGAARAIGLPYTEIIAVIQWGFARGKENPTPVQELSPRLRLWLNRQARRGR